MATELAMYLANQSPSARFADPLSAASGRTAHGRDGKKAANLAALSANRLALLAAFYTLIRARFWFLVFGFLLFSFFLFFFFLAHVRQGWRVLVPNNASLQQGIARLPLLGCLPRAVSGRWRSNPGCP